MPRAAPDAGVIGGFAPPPAPPPSAPKAERTKRVAASEARTAEKAQREADQATRQAAEAQHRTPPTTAAAFTMVDEDGKTWVPNDLQYKVLDSMASGATVIAVEAGWGSGKSLSLIMALLWRHALRPGTRSVLVTDTLRRYFDNLDPEMQRFAVPRGWEWVARLERWVHPDGGEVIVRYYRRQDGAPRSKNPLEGINATSGLAVIDEAQVFEREVLLAAAGRIRSGEDLTLIVAGLPDDSGATWWGDAARRLDGAADGIRAVVCTAPSSVNRANLHGSWDPLVRAIDPDQAQRLLDGERVDQGQVYRVHPDMWPAGNMLPGWWRYDPSMTGRLAVDWGVRKPAALVIVHDEKLGADIVVAEVCPQDVTLADFARAITAIAWPREGGGMAPGPRWMLDDGACDKSGMSRSDQTGISNARAFLAPPPEGVGLALQSTSDPVKLDRRNRIRMTARRLGFAGGQQDGRIVRRLLIAPWVWDPEACGRPKDPRALWLPSPGSGKHDPWVEVPGVRPSGISLRSAIGAYRVRDTQDPGADLPDVDSDSPIDPVDALEYDTARFAWALGGSPRRAPSVAWQRREDSQSRLVRSLRR